MPHSTCRIRRSAEKSHLVRVRVRVRVGVGVGVRVRVKVNLVRKIKLVGERGGPRTW